MIGLIKRSLQKVKKATDITQSTVKKIQKNYKPIEEYKPTGSFVYDQGSMSSLEEKTKTNPTCWEVEYLKSSKIPFLNLVRFLT